MDTPSRYWLNDLPSRFNF
ncbi:YsgD/CorL family protein [uncultured Cedecea sp.]